MSQMQEIAEQRRSIRYACVLEASIPRIGNRVYEPVLLVKVADISTGGVGLHCSEKLEVDSVVTIKLYGQERESLPPRRATIIHVTELPNGTWKMGAAFEKELSEAEMGFILA